MLERMLQYKFHNSKTKHGGEYNIIAVESPYEYVSQLVEGNESSDYISDLLDHIKQVESGELQQGSIENQTGFMVYLFAPNPNGSEPDGGADIYYGLSNQEPLEPIYRIPLNDLIQLLEEFRDFLKENGR